MTNKISRLFWAIVLITLSVVVGITGYTLIEGYSITDAFYMSIITIGTVGFQEVRPLSEFGKVFTSFYIILNLTIFAFVISVITSYLFEGELQRLYKKFMADRGIRKLSNHVIVCGYGRNGMRAVEELKFNNFSTVLIENDHELLTTMEEAKHFHIIQGDATDDDVLLSAGIDKASYLITTLPKDADNVFITLTAKGLNSKIEVIARASEENSEKKLLRAGADKVVMPDALGGIHMAQLITKPDVIEFLNLLNGVGNIKLKLEEFSFEDLNKDCHHKSIRDLDIRNNTGVTIIGFKHKNKDFVFNPSADTVLDENAVLIVLGHEETIQEFRNHYCKL